MWSTSLAHFMSAPITTTFGQLSRVSCRASAVATADSRQASSSLLSSRMASVARRTWEAANQIEEDALYAYDPSAHQQLLAAKPWEKDPHFFQHIRISALALLKMVMHARSGGNLEVMGLLLGKVDGPVMVVMDAFALPVEGTETRVNAQAQGYEYMTEYIEAAKKVGRLENALGWYHSHPGYGCWLSGIDVSTQMLNQNYQDPFVAIVVDPVRTVSAGKVNLGAFRTYPKGYKPPDDEPSEYQTIPLNKIEDFGVHCKSYYQLEVSYFKSRTDQRLLDSLWNHYWLNTLSSCSLISNGEYTTGQIADLADKLETMESQIKGNASSSLVTTGYPGAVASGVDSGERKIEERLFKATKDASKITTEVLTGLVGQAVKSRLFNQAI